MTAEQLENGTRTLASALGAMMTAALCRGLEVRPGVTDQQFREIARRGTAEVMSASSMLLVGAPDDLSDEALREAVRISASRILDQVLGSPELV